MSDIDNLLSIYFGSTVRFCSLNIEKDSGLFRINASFEICNTDALLTILSDKAVIKEIRQERTFYDYSDSTEKTLSYMVTVELLYGSKLTKLIMENFNVR